MYSFPILNQSVVPCPVLTFASWPASRFLSRQVRWSGIPISLRIFHRLLWSTVKGFSVVNEAEVDVFSGILLLFLWSNRCWQFDLWFKCLQKQEGQTPGIPSSIINSQSGLLDKSVSCEFEIWVSQITWPDPSINVLQFWWNSPNRLQNITVMLVVLFSNVKPEDPQEWKPYP